MAGLYKPGDLCIMDHTTGDRMTLKMEVAIISEAPPGMYWVATDMGVAMQIAEGALAPAAQGQASTGQPQVVDLTGTTPIVTGAG